MKWKGSRNSYNLFLDTFVPYLEGLRKTTKISWLE
jgi:hypothetical protein